MINFALDKFRGPKSDAAPLGVIELVGEKRGSANKGLYALSNKGFSGRGREAPMRK